MQCYCADVIATLIVTNFHLCLIQLWWQFLQIFVYDDVVYSQTWDLKKVGHVSFANTVMSFTRPFWQITYEWHNYCFVWNYFFFVIDHFEFVRTIFKSNSKCPYVFLVLFIRKHGGLLGHFPFNCYLFFAAHARQRYWKLAWNSAHFHFRRSQTVVY